MQMIRRRRITNPLLEQHPMNLKAAALSVAAFFWEVWFANESCDVDV
jgi:hypothetical protein